MTQPEPTPFEAFNVADEVVADLAGQVASQARELAILRAAVKQRDLLIEQLRGQEHTHDDEPDKPESKAKGRRRALAEA